MARSLPLTVPLMLACLARTAAAAEGSLDPTFGTGGKVVGGFGEATAIAVYPDGRLLLGGGLGSFALARYHSDGTLDTTFGGDGTISTSGDGERAVSDLVILGDERIVAVGYALDGHTDLMRLIRYNPDGTIDATYGTAGKVTATFPGGAVSGRGVLQPDGKLLDVAIEQNAGGATYSIAIARFDPDGSPDLGFGSGGKTVTNFPDVGEYGTAVVLAPDGRFYVVGAASTDVEQYESRWLIVRHNADGSVDTTFGDGGRVIESFYDGYAYARAMGAALLPDGKLVVGGDSGGFPALARYDANGNLDPTFGDWGKVVVTSFPQFEAAGLARRPDGKLFLAATAYRGPEDVYSPNDVAIMAFEANGQVDATFAPCPQVSTGFGTDDARARRLALQPDGKPIVVGGLASGALAMVRYGMASTPACQPAASRRSTLTIRNVTADARDSLKWAWQGAPVGPTDLGDPTTTTGYTLCVIDQSSGQPTLRLGSPLMRADWSASPSARTFKARSESDFPYTKVQLRTTTAGSGKFKLGAKGEYLHPSLPLALPATVRIVRDDADTCWEATYTSAKRNEAGRFSARSE